MLKLKQEKLRANVTLKEAYLATYRLAKGDIKVSQDDVIMTVGSFITGIPVIHKNEVVWAIGSRFGCAGTLAFSDVIYVDDFYLYLPKHVQEFIIAHELGHIKCKHNLRIKRPFLNSFKRIFKLSELEVEADSYAVKQLGYKSCYNALSYLIHDTDLPLLTKNELKKRLKQIEDLELKKAGK